MKFFRTEKYHIDFQKTKMTGPNSMLIAEELLSTLDLRPTMTALDVACGKSLSSLLVAKEFGMRLFAVDDIVDPFENFTFYKKINMQNQIIPLKLDFSGNLPFCREYFDLILCAGSFNIIAEKILLKEKILPLLKKNGTLAVAMPISLNDEITPLLREFFGENASTLHNIDWWKKYFESQNANLVECALCQCNDRAWSDWFLCTDEKASVRDAAFAEKGALSEISLAKFIVKA